ncbi:O-antigen ligase family protein [Mariprofundus ferrooxydans]|uniref:O-antigen ligase family protein n=1 Tax=Mariprofundus ferrooxydans TaxID=314344 RepID=UPI0009D9A412|nr:O-antigen ligase family protein [Mariprofundus ferrooxydans]
MKYLITILLCIAALLFPFLVAASNFLLGVALACSILSGLWWSGANLCWKNYRLLSIIMCAYVVLVVLGLLWSLDLKWGLHVVGRHWFWLLIPVIVTVLENEQWRKWFLLSLSSGLALNLVYCVLQMLGYVEVNTDGSNAADATGLIGHIGFGFVYGLWAAWLLHLGLLWGDNRRRWVVWGAAAWSYVMIFAAQGRSGYLIAVMLMVCVLIKWVFDSKRWQTVLPVIVGFVLILLVVALGPGKERLQGTWFAFTQTVQEKELDQLNSSDNAILATDERFQMWKTAIDIWHQYPLLGVGTGGLPKAVSVMKSQGLSSAPSVFVHPHNQYLLDLVRWGPVGLLLLVGLLVVWMREGLKVDWQHSLTAPLSTLSGLALVLHGLSSSGMEEHFSAILAVLLLGVALSDSRQYVNTGGKQCN